MNDEQKEQLRALREKKQKAADAAQEESELRELEEGELEVKLEQLTGGKRGVEFEIVNTRFGVFGVKKPDHQAVTSWDKASSEKKVTLDWQIGILRHYILPDPNKDGIEWAKLVALRPGVCWETAAAFARLMGVEADEEKKGR